MSKKYTSLPVGVDENKDGHVIIQDGLSVSLSEENVVYMFIDKESRDNIRTGMYVQIPYPYNSNPDEDNELEKGTNDELFGIISEMRYIQSGDVNEYSKKKDDSSPLRDNVDEMYAEIAKIEPISIIEKGKQNGDIAPIGTRSLDSVPKPTTNVYQSTREEYMRTGLGIPEEGITIGYLTANGMRLPPSSPLSYNIMNPGFESEQESAVWRHTLISGSTGVGKSHTAKNIIRQLTDGTRYEIEDNNGIKTNKKPCIVVIDPENEYAQMGQDPEGADEEVLKEIERKGALVGGINQDDSEFDLKSFVPDVDYFDDPNLKGVKTDFSIPFKITENKPKIAINYGANAPTMNAARKMLENYFNHPAGNDTYDEFTTWLQNLTDEEREEWGINEMSWDAAMERFDSKVFERVFDTGSAKITEPSVSREMFKPGRVSVIPTGHLGVSSQNLVIMSILSLIVENKIGSGNVEEIRETPLILCMDEAHNYLSDFDTVRGRYIVNKFRDAAKQGRKYKLGLMMITQNPEDIDDEIRKQTNTRIYLGLREESLDRLNLKPKIRKKVSDFSKGQMMVQSPGVNSVEVEGFEECVTKHN